MRRAVCPQLTPPPLALDFHNHYGEWADSYESQTFEIVTTLQPSIVSQLVEFALEFDCLEFAIDGLTHVLSHAASLVRMHIAVYGDDEDHEANVKFKVQRLSAVRCPTVRILLVSTYPTAYKILGAVLLQALPNLERLILDLEHAAPFDSSDDEDVSSKDRELKSGKKKTASIIPQVNLPRVRRVNFQAFMPALEAAVAQTCAMNLHHLCINTAMTAVVSAVYNAGLAFQLPIRSLVIYIGDEFASNNPEPSLLPIAGMKGEDRGLAIIRALPYLSQLFIDHSSGEPLNMLDAVCGSLRTLCFERNYEVVEIIGDALKANHKALAGLKLYVLPHQTGRVPVPAIFGERRIKVCDFDLFERTGETLATDWTYF